MNLQLSGSNHFKHTYNEGFAAAQLGLSKNNCLYNPGTMQFTAWNKGYNAAIEMEQDLNDEERLGDRLLVGLLVVIVFIGVGLLFLSRL